MKKRSKTNWARIDSLKDSEIDYSDNPELGPGFFAKAVRWPGNKELISLRLDPDVLAFFRNQGKGYQTTINTLLRNYMEAQTPGPGRRQSSTSRRPSRTKVSKQKRHG